MTVQDLEKIAASGGDMPDGLRMPDIAFFQAMRGLYTVYKIGRISRDKAKSEKKEIMKQYRDACQIQEQYDYHRKISRDLSHISQKIKHSGCDCCKAVADAVSGVFHGT